MTLRGYVRVAYSTTIEQLGQIYCDIVSFATTHNHPENQSIIKNLVAIRMKLRRVAVLADNVAYEVNSYSFHAKRNIHVGPGFFAGDLAQRALSQSL